MTDEMPADTVVESQHTLQPGEQSSILDQASEDPQIIETDLVLPPAQRTVAPRPDDLTRAEYVEANSATDLPVVGGLQGWFAEGQGDDHWGPSKSFVGFAPETKVTDPAQLELCVRRAVLEALAVLSSTGVEGLLEESWRADGGWERVLGLSVKVDGEGQATVEGDVRSVVEGLVGDVGAREEMLPVGQAREIVTMTNKDWKLVPLKDAKLKFAVSHALWFYSMEITTTSEANHTPSIPRLQNVSSNSPAMPSPTPKCSTSKPWVGSSRRSSNQSHRAGSTRRSSSAAS